MYTFHRNLHHSAALVYAIVKKLVNTVKNYVPELKPVHFWTDSPLSQYRNKSVFDLISRFEVNHGCKATWHYFESGHEKNACGGVVAPQKGTLIMQ
jgi:hypothetical protein